MNNEVMLTEWKRNLAANLESFVDMYFTKGYVNPEKFPIRNDRVSLNELFVSYLNTGRV